ncbi:FtsW/RodA/SpoVE family cell cycle protein, partial [bacterium]|nr:FtsW/RodA/SpoVE family cell cycle protein [bacterium]
MNRTLRGFAGTIEHADRGLLLAAGMLIFLGSIVVFGAGSSTTLASRSLIGPWYVIVRHAVMIGAGLVAMFALMHFDYRRYRLPWANLVVLGLAYGLVGLTLFTTRVDASGQETINRWVTIAGFRFQPVEFAKIAMIVFLAERLTRVRRGVKLQTRELAVALALGPLPLLVLLALQPNYGNVMVTVGVTLVILFATGTSERWLLRLVGVAPVIAVLGYVFSYKVRLRADQLLQGLKGGSFGYQVDQSLIGLGAGGLTGLGPGQSQNKFSFLPESHTDFAFSVLGE